MWNYTWIFASAAVIANSPGLNQLRFSCNFFRTNSYTNLQLELSVIILIIRTAFCQNPKERHKKKKPSWATLSPICVTTSPHRFVPNVIPRITISLFSARETLGKKLYSNTGAWMSNIKIFWQKFASLAGRRLNRRCLRNWTSSLIARWRRFWDNNDFLNHEKAKPSLSILLPNPKFPP